MSTTRAISPRDLVEQTRRAHHNGDEIALPDDALAGERAFCVFGDGLWREEDRIGRQADVHARHELMEQLHACLIAHDREVYAGTRPPDDDPAGEAQGADALREDDGLRACAFCLVDEPCVVEQAAQARGRLQKTATAADKDICLAQHLSDARRRRARHGFHAELLRLLGLP